MHFWIQTNTFENLDKYLLQFVLCSLLSSSVTIRVTEPSPLLNLNSLWLSSHFGQIHLSIQTNTFWQFGHKTCCKLSSVLFCHLLSQFGQTDSLTWLKLILTFIRDQNGNWYQGSKSLGSKPLHCCNFDQRNEVNEMMPIIFILNPCNLKTLSIQKIQAKLKRANITELSLAWTLMGNLERITVWW